MSITQPQIGINTLVQKIYRRDAEPTEIFDFLSALRVLAVKKSFTRIQIWNC